MRTDLLTYPGSDGYVESTSPHNSSVVQQPVAVARPNNARDVADVVQWATDRNLTVAVQASGHGAGAPIRPDQILIDTSGMATTHIDPQARVARTGAGATWAHVNAAAQRHGLLGLAGSSPTVAVAGYTFFGGVGWLVRPHGMASSALLTVEYVDGEGRIRRAAPDATDPVDREALWAFRGGGGVGVATRLEFELAAPPAVWAGYRLWDIEALEPVVTAWVAAMDVIGDELTTSISVLRTPPDGPFPPELRGVPIVHLAFASSAGEAAAAPLLNALRAVPRPVVDDAWAPADAARLSSIHLDPPQPVPALGIGRWLGPNTPTQALDMLVPVAAPDSALAMIELRNTANGAVTRDGALTAVPAPFLLHAVGLSTEPSVRRATEEGLALVRAAASAVDVGWAATAFAEGRAGVDGGLPAAQLSRLAAARTAVDADHRIAASRLLADSGAV
jgi:FAD/FMN-containing dehydrogenase